MVLILRCTKFPLFGSEKKSLEECKFATPCAQFTVALH